MRVFSGQTEVANTSNLPNERSLLVYSKERADLRVGETTEGAGTHAQNHEVGKKQGSEGKGTRTLRTLRWKVRGIDLGDKRGAQSLSVRLAGDKVDT